MNDLKKTFLFLKLPKHTMKFSLSLFFLLAFSNVMSQEKPYFYHIPATPEKFTSENVAARMVDGLGFRYFWATEGLTPKDLAYEPNEEARTTHFTLEHIFDLCNIIKQTVLKTDYKADGKISQYTFEELRNMTLENLKIASEALKKTDADLATTKMVFIRADGTKNSFDSWYLINGPISDAIWHVGQVVSFRRSSGNPLPKRGKCFTRQKELMFNVIQLCVNYCAFVKVNSGF